MIRTRDLVLFVLCLLVLLLAILFTVLSERGRAVSLNLEPNEIPEAQETEATLGDAPAGIDRAANLARLREKLALDTSSVTPAPDTFVEDVPPEETDAPVESDIEATVRRCLYPDDVLPKVAGWPMGKVKLVVSGNERVAYTEETVVVAGAASTSASAETETAETVRTKLLALPVNPVALPVASCVPSEVIGVTPSGILLFNNDARIWQNVSADTLIGYARDGYPMYGRYDGEVDACGGYQHPSGYRYTIGADRSYIVGCFVATPQSFSL